VNKLNGLEAQASGDGLLSAKAMPAAPILINSLFLLTVMK
jgi:hypothetical protein